MKKRTRNLVIDLTSFLDVILILMFLALLMNTGEMEDFKTQLDESEELRINVELELGLALDALDDANERLAALSDWDDERIGLLDEIGALTDWKTATAGAIHFITVDVQSDVEPRLLNIYTEHSGDGSFEIIWSDTTNEISNETQLDSDLSDLLRDIIESNSSEKPTLIMFDHTGIRRQEFNLIDRCIKSVIALENTQNGLKIYYSPYISN